jgi:hypothetical protein
MAAIALVMISLAAVCRSSYLSSAALLTATLFVLILASIKARHTPFWLGFALAGWAYFVLNLGPWFETTIGRHGLGAALADLFYASVGPESALVAGREGKKVALAQIPYLQPSWVWHAWNGWENGLANDLPLCPTTYLRTVHCLITLSVAWLGGMVARANNRRVLSANAYPVVASDPPQPL